MMHHPRHPALYEVNTRVLLSSLGQGKTLADIPAKFWKDLKHKGIDWVWLMGVWEIQEKALDPYVIPQEMMSEFRDLMHDLTDDDLCGSPYAIHDYVIDPDVGTDADLRALRKTLQGLGMKLMLDFVPNHFGAHTRWLEEHPAYFIEVDEQAFLRDGKTFYRPWHDRNRFFAHGKDPYFDAWQDTIQVNYANPEAQIWMSGMLKKIASMCDGVRCDMAMLPVARIFNKTWSHLSGDHEQEEEFWPAAIESVKSAYPHFLLLAECYWDMEAELMQMGFDYCYDKVFYDRIPAEDVDKMRQHFHAEQWWLVRTARFLENHDEHRAAALMHLQRHMAAAALVAFGPGMRFWHMGQWEGRRKKVPVQISRYPQEATCGCVLNEGVDVPCGCVSMFYEKLLSINQDAVFREGDWRVVHEHSAEHGLICWLWEYQDIRILVVINYADCEAVFSLADQLHLLHLQDPMDVFRNDASIDPHAIHTLAPWGVYAWRARSI